MVTKFEVLYREEATEQTTRYEALRAGYLAQFGEAPIRFFSAPGRTELGGNHTDHNHGRVVAAGINLDIIAAAAKTDTGRIRLKSKEYPGVDQVDAEELAPLKEEAGTTRALIKGVCRRCQDLGFQVGGFDAYTMSRVLKGSGLSSSAAFEIAIVTILSHLYNDDGIDGVAAAQIAQYAENTYFGKPCGLLDQMAASVGGVVAMDFFDPQNPMIEKLSLDLQRQQHVLCVVDTGGNHADLTDEYAAVPAEMKAVAAALGKDVLRAVDEAEFWREIPALRKSCGDRAVLRSMHFFDEDKLAQAQAEALKTGDFSGFLQLVTASGRSSETRLQNTVSTTSSREQGVALGLALAKKTLNGQGACRVHGGGFAGTIQAFVPMALLPQFREKLEAVFGAGSCHVIFIRDVGGTEVVW